MGNLFSNIRKFWQDAKERRRYAHIIAPENIGAEAQKFIDLVEISLCNGHFSSIEAQHLQTLQKEMEKVVLLTEKKEFQRLSVDRRLQLHRSLRRSLEKVMASIQESDSPTARIQ